MASQRDVVIEDSKKCIIRLALGPFSTNAYIVICKDTAESALVDAPGEAALLLERLQESKPQYILMTHSHADHTGALDEVKEALKIPLAAHEADSAALPVKPDIFLEDACVISLGSLELTVIHTPGHTPGSLCFLVGSTLIAGDTIFPGGPGKTWSPADFRQIIDSLSTKIFTLPGEIEIFPGHGTSATLGAEKESFQRFISQTHAADLYGDISWLK